MSFFLAIRSSRPLLLKRQLGMKRAIFKQKRGWWANLKIPSFTPYFWAKQLSGTFRFSTANHAAFRIPAVQKRCRSFVKNNSLSPRDHSGNLLKAIYLRPAPFLEVQIPTRFLQDPILTIFPYNHFNPLVFIKTKIPCSLVDFGNSFSIIRKNSLLKRLTQ